MIARREWVIQKPGKGRRTRKRSPLGNQTPPGPRHDDYCYDDDGWNEVDYQVDLSLSYADLGVRSHRVRDLIPGFLVIPDTLMPSA